jgi:hypothetical protein
MPLPVTYNKYKSKQEYVNNNEQREWLLEFNKYYDYVDIHSKPPSLTITFTDERKLAEWAFEQNILMDKANKGELNIMKRNSFVYGTWKTHKPNI